MSTTPVRITLRANEWGIIADILEDAAEHWAKVDQRYASSTADKWSQYLNMRIEGK